MRYLLLLLLAGCSRFETGDEELLNYDIEVISDGVECVARVRANKAIVHTTDDKKIDNPAELIKELKRGED